VAGEEIEAGADADEGYAVGCLRAAIREDLLLGGAERDQADARSGLLDEGETGHGLVGHGIEAVLRRVHACDDQVAVARLEVVRRARQGGERGPEQEDRDQTRAGYRAKGLDKIAA